MNYIDTRELDWKGELRILSTSCKNFKVGYCYNCPNCANFELKFKKKTVSEKEATGSAVMSQTLSEPLQKPNISADSKLTANQNNAR